MFVVMIQKNNLDVLQDTSIPSFIQREVTANVIVAIPHALHISNTHLETPVYPATVLKLRAYNSHTLKAIFFTKNNQPFTLSHHYLTASSLSNKTGITIFYVYFDFSS
jgi:hypothetical protein